MKTIPAVLTLLVLALVGTTLAAPQTEPPAYPAGTYCSRAGTVTSAGRVLDPSHPCHCAKMIHGTDCEGEVTESPTCKQWCRAGKCRCPALCLGDADAAGQAAP